MPTFLNHEHLGGGMKGGGRGQNIHHETTKLAPLTKLDNEEKKCLANCLNTLGRGISIDKICTLQANLRVKFEKSKPPPRS